MLIFLKILPYILNSIKDHIHVKFIIELIEITQILFAPLLFRETLQKLRAMIEKHLKTFRELFPDNNITPKQHYILHFPSQIEALGLGLGDFSISIRDRNKILIDFDYLLVTCIRSHVAKVSATTVSKSAG